MRSHFDMSPKIPRLDFALSFEIERTDEPIFMERVQSDLRKDLEIRSCVRHRELPCNDKRRRPSEYT